MVCVMHGVKVSRGLLAMWIYLLAMYGFVNDMLGEVSLCVVLYGRLVEVSLLFYVLVASSCCYIINLSCPCIVS